jgi:hypothetical protein
LISGCDEIIAKMLSMGYTKDSSQIRQELHLKHKYCQEMTSIFQSQNAQIHIVEDELRQAA